MKTQDIEKLDARLYKIFCSPEFLEARGLANEVPLFIQCYSPSDEDAIRQLVRGLTQRLQNAGVVVQTFDLFERVMNELKEADIAETLLEHEHTYDKPDLLETLENYSDPAILTEKLAAEIGEDTQLTLITGSGRVFPFLRTHAILESLQPRMQNQRPIVFFFPGQYRNDPEHGPQLQLFAGETRPDEPKISQSYYRAINLDDYHLSEK